MPLPLNVKVVPLRLPCTPSPPVITSAPLVVPVEAVALVFLTGEENVLAPLHVCAVPSKPTVPVAGTVRVEPKSILKLALLAAGLALPVMPRKTGEESREKGITPALPVTVPASQSVDWLANVTVPYTVSLALFVSTPLIEDVPLMSALLIGNVAARVACVPIVNAESNAKKRKKGGIFIELEDAAAEHG